MNLKWEKKGFSRILIASLIILVFLITVGILFITIRSFMQGGSVPLGKSTLNLKIEKAQLIENDLSLTIKRNPGGRDFVGLNFVVDDNKKSEKFTRDISMNELEIKTFTFTLDKTNPDNLQTVKITPIFKSKSGKRVVGDSEYIWESSSGIYRCTPDCNEKTCGENGCGGTCGDCANEYTCYINNTCIPSDACIDTCDSLQYQCGIVCGIDCGNCTNQHGTTSCVSGKCQPICENDYSNCDLNAINGCETQLGTTTNCASCGNNCSAGDICTNNICALPCTDSCTSLNYNCGIQTVCGRKILCGVCPSGFNCQTNGSCIKQ